MNRPIYHFLFGSLFWLIPAIMLEGKVESNLKEYSTVGEDVKLHG